MTFIEGFFLFAAIVGIVAAAAMFGRGRKLGGESGPPLPAPTIEATKVAPAPVAPAPAPDPAFREGVVSPGGPGKVEIVASIPADETLAQYALRSKRVPPELLGALLMSAYKYPPGLSNEAIVDRFLSPEDYKSSAQRAEEKMIADEQAKAAAKVYEGAIPIDSLSHEDRVYLYLADKKLRSIPGAPDLHYEAGIVGGPRAEIAAAVNEAHYDAAGKTMEGYNGPLKTAVEEVLAKYGAAPSESQQK
jgi:hypothetical protein